MEGAKYLFLILFLISSTKCFLFPGKHFNRRVFKTESSSYQNTAFVEEDVGDPLILTPLIEAGNLEEARNLSLVGDIGVEGIPSYSGFLTVNPEHNGNLFF